MKKYNKGYSCNGEWNIVRHFRNNSLLLKYYGVKIINDQHYLFMEYYPGVTLKSYFEDYFTQTKDITREIHNLVTSLSLCLLYLSKNNISHNDLISRKNILVNPNTGRTVIIDFGVNVDRSGGQNMLSILICLLQSDIETLIQKGFIIRDIRTIGDVYKYLRSRLLEIIN